jgi:hypothetical protein
VVKWLTPLHIRKVPGSNLGPDTGYPEVFRCYSQSIHINAGIIPEN